jgi:uncharacterized protein
MKNIFVGPDGLRSGWRAVIFIAVVVAAARLAGALFNASVARQLTAVGGIPGPRIALEFELAFLVPVLIATGVMALAEGRSFWSYGLTETAGLKRFGWGVFWGFAVLSALVGLLVLTGHLAFDGTALAGFGTVRFAVEWAVVFLFVGMAEEMALRGYLQAALTRGMGFWPAAVLTSIGFGALHLGNGGEGIIGVIAAGAAGLVFCYSLYRTGSLWWAIGAHLSWDWGQSYFYGVPDSGEVVSRHLFVSHPLGATYLSGGTVGPEGSVFAALALVAFVLVIFLTIRPTTQWSRAC